jgi:NADH:ubiquinone oxidoreductase subunit 4 (subunit M)
LVYGVFVSLFSIRQTGLTLLIAYSSLAHVSIVIGGVVYNVEFFMVLEIFCLDGGSWLVFFWLGWCTSVLHCDHKATVRSYESLPP